MHRPKILYVYRQSGHHYKVLDYEILSSKYTVERFAYDAYNLRTCIDLKRKIQQADLVFFWFATALSGLGVYWANHCKIPSVIVAGGFDVANYPPMRHGGRFRPLQKYPIRYALEHASLVLPVSHFNENEMLSFTRPQKYQMIYNGVDVDFNQAPPPMATRAAQIVTVGSIDPFYSRMKGHFHFAEIAKRMDDVNCVIIGPNKCPKTLDQLQTIAEGKIDYRGELPHAEVLNVFRQSKIYLQLSHYESFGVTVPEAMACGCHPIVSNRGALPEIVEEWGDVVELDDYSQIQQLVESRIGNNQATPPDYAQRAEAFSAENRKQALLEKISQLL